MRRVESFQSCPKANKTYFLKVFFGPSKVMYYGADPGLCDFIKPCYQLATTDSHVYYLVSLSKIYRPRSCCVCAYLEDKLRVLETTPCLQYAITVEHIVQMLRAGITAYHQEHCCCSSSYLVL